VGVTVVAMVPAVSLNLQGEGLAGALTDDVDQLLPGGHGSAIHGEHAVAGKEAGLGGGPFAATRPISARASLTGSMATGRNWRSRARSGMVMVTGRASASSMVSSPACAAMRARATSSMLETGSPPTAVIRVPRGMSAMAWVPSGSQPSTTAPTTGSDGEGRPQIMAMEANRTTASSAFMVTPAARTTARTDAGLASKVRAGSMTTSDSAPPSSASISFIPASLTYPPSGMADTRKSVSPRLNPNSRGPSPMENRVTCMSNARAARKCPSSCTRIRTPRTPIVARIVTITPPPPSLRLPQLPPFPPTPREQEAYLSRRWRGARWSAAGAGSERPGWGGRRAAGAALVGGIHSSGPNRRDQQPTTWIGSAPGPVRSNLTAHTADNLARTRPTSGRDPTCHEYMP
jgi:hypothetical protein